MPAGRPKIPIDDRAINNIEQLAGYGLSLAQIAAVIGIGARTLRTRKNEAKISAALERGRAKAQGHVGKALFERAKGGDVAAIRWWEMTRAGRTEAQRREMQVSGPGGGPIQHEGAGLSALLDAAKERRDGES